MVASNINANPQLNTTVVVVIVVVDRNDNPPVFSPDQYSVSISENKTSPAFVLRVTAMDDDEPMVSHTRCLWSCLMAFVLFTQTSNSEITFSVDAQGIPFSIGPVSGELILASSLDREDEPFYNVRMICLE